MTVRSPGTGVLAMKYKYLLFDLDGTLTDSAEGITKCVQYAMHSFGFEEPDLNKLRCFVGPPLADMFMQYCGWPRERAEAAIGKYRERFQAKGMFENSVYEGIPEVLRMLAEDGQDEQEKRVLVVASSKPEKFVRIIMEHFGILQYFDEVVGASLDGKLSRKVDIIAEVFRRLRLTSEQKNEVLMIGDRNHDVLGAKEAGVDCLGVYYGFADPGELEEAGADYIVDTVEEMGELLKRI